MEKTIKIVKQTIISNEVAKVGSIHKLSIRLCDIHVGSGNAIYVEDGQGRNRAIGVEGSDSEPKKRGRKKRG
jgi:hypothetical protein